MVLKYFYHHPGGYVFVLFVCLIVHRITFRIMNGVTWNFYPICVSTKEQSLNLNPLGPHDALKHHLVSLKNNLISWNLVVLERKFSWKCFKNNIIFFHLSPTLSHFHPLQVENCGSNSRLVVDENDNGKLRLERVNGWSKFGSRIRKCSSQLTVLCENIHTPRRCWDVEATSMTRCVGLTLAWSWPTVYDAGRVLGQRWLGSCLLGYNSVSDSGAKQQSGCVKWNEMNRALGHLCAHIG